MLAMCFVETAPNGVFEVVAGRWSNGKAFKASVLADWINLGESEARYARVSGYSRVSASSVVGFHEAGGPSSMIFL
jgi:hypothetical protein